MAANPTDERDKAIAVRTAIHAMPMPDYAERFLRIRTKTKAIQPLVLNVGQLYLHRKAEMQMQSRGYVRIVLLKARQWGGSTYIQGRSYWKVAARGTPGMRSYILTHSGDATNALFAMTHRFHSETHPLIRPAAKVSRKRIEFPLLHSSYAVATAGSKAVGRSETLQFFHGSECAYWPDAEAHMGGALQTVPASGPDTEVYLESTGNGMGNPFHAHYSNARAQLGDYEAVFVPWSWFDEYTAHRGELELSAEDAKYMELWNLSEPQMLFRQNKIVEFGGGEAGRIKFGIEYPMMPEEAFSSNIKGGYISAPNVLMARRRLPWLASKFGPKIMGIDPSWTGDDRFVVWIRQGRYAKRVGRWTGLRSAQSVQRVKAIAEREQPDVMCMDIGGLGGPLFDQIDAVLDERIIRIPVMGGERPDDEQRWRNKRSEMWGRMKEWFDDPITPCIDDAVSTNEDDKTRAMEEIQGDVTCVLTDWDDKGRPTVESKKKVLSHSPSPDNAEALATTFVVRFGPDWKPSQQQEREHARRPINWRAH